MGKYNEPRSVTITIESCGCCPLFLGDEDKCKESGKELVSTYDEILESITYPIPHDCPMLDKG